MNFRRDLREPPEIYFMQCQYILRGEHSKKEEIYIYFFNWDSSDARLNSHCGAWSYKKSSTNKITGYRRSV